MSIFPQSINSKPTVLTIETKGMQTSKESDLSRDVSGAQLIIRERFVSWLNLGVAVPLQGIRTLGVSVCR